MSKQSDRVKKWRENAKIRMVEAMGGKCQICNYNKCYRSLDFHHLNPEEKDFNFGKVMAEPKAWTKIVNELKKCILLCKNCHMEVHAGMTQIPESFSTFDEKIIEKKEAFTPCPVCKKDKPIQNKFCSLSCSGRSKMRVDWDSIDLKEELKTKSIKKLAGELDISDISIHKRMKKLGLK